MEHFFDEFGDPSCVVFEISCGKNRQTNKETHKAAEDPARATIPSAWLSKTSTIDIFIAMTFLCNYGFCFFKSVTNV